MEPSLTSSARAAARIPVAIFLFGALFGVLGTLAVVRQTHTVRIVERAQPALVAPSPTVVQVPLYYPAWGGRPFIAAF